MNKSAKRRVLDDCGPAHLNLGPALDEAAIVAQTDAHGVITYVNARFCEISGYSADELTGATHSMVKSGAHPKSFFKSMYGVIAKGKTWRGTICNRRKDGSLYWVDTTIVPTLAPDGRPASYTAIRFDVTAHVEAKRALEEANRREELASRGKSEFLANISHEIRTPLNGVLGVADALAATRLDAGQGRMVRLIQNSGDTLARILSDMLDLAKIEAGKMEIEAAPFSLKREIESATFLYFPRADAKGVELSIEFDPSLADSRLGDAVKLKQIISNMVSNAIKFTESGSVRIKVEPGHKDEIVVSVSDTGIGIDADKISSLFQPFQQADGTIARRFGGTGLGLSISKSLAEAMGGAVVATSKIGAGSTFTLRLPLRKTDEVSTSKDAGKARGKNIRKHKPSILVVDDHAANRLVVELLLKPFGANITSAEDGNQALDRVCHDRFDCILMDWSMPGMDGLAATRQIRALEVARRSAKTPIVIFTARTSKADEEEAMKAGADAFLTKPISLSALVDCMDRFLPSRAAAAG